MFSFTKFCDYMLNVLANLTMTFFFTVERESESPEGPRPSVHIARAGKGTSGGSRLVGGGSQSVVVICHSTHEPGGRATHVSLYLHKDLYIDTSSDVGLYRPYVFLYRNVFTTAQRGYATTIQGLGVLRPIRMPPPFFRWWVHLYHNTTTGPCAFSSKMQIIHSDTIS